MSDEAPAPGRHPATRALSAALAAALVLLALAQALGVDRAFGLVVFREQFLAAMLALALALVFLLVPLGGGTRAGAVPWYDVLAALAGFAAASYVAWRYPTLVEDATYDASTALPYGTVLLVLVLEGLRRTAGNALTAIVLVFLAYALVGHLVPGELTGRSLSLSRLAADLTLDPNGLLGTPLLVSTTIVVAFVFFGHLLSLSGGASFFTNISLALMGRYRGGSAKISIVASSLFGSISGSAVSNVVSTGVVTIPLMKRDGYPSHVAAAIEAVASTGGQLMPPIMGASAFLMAEFLEIGYGAVVRAALVPAILYYVALFIQADLRAAQASISRVPEAEIPSARRTLASGWHFPVPFAVLILALFWLNLQPEEAAIYAAATLLAFVTATWAGAAALGRRRAGALPREFAALIGAALTRTGTTALDIIMITAAAGLIMGVLNFTGLSFALTLVLVKLGSSSVVALLVIAAFICTLLGMGMPTIGVYVLLAALVAPAMVKLGIEPVAAHMFVLYFGMMSMITPPVAIAAFAAATLAEARPMRTGIEAVRFGWPAYVVPFLFVAAPSLLLRGTVGETVLALATAVAGVWLASVAAVGYLVRPIGPGRRLAFAAAGIAALVPAGMFEGAFLTDLAGIAVGAALVAFELLARRRAAP